MNALRCLAILFIGVAALKANESNAPPSGITIEYDTKGAAYFYMIVANGENIGIFTSCYQPEIQNEDWSAAQTRSASWHWSDDGATVAIEETNHRLMGTVILARRVYGAYEPVPLAIHEFMAHSDEEWDRCRLLFGGWVDDKRARLILSEHTGRSPGPYDFVQYEFTVDVHSSGKIESCKKVNTTTTDSEQDVAPNARPAATSSRNDR